MASKKIHINGIVQGVGFRPFIYSTAMKFDIKGWVRNSSAGVDIHATGDENNITDFIETIKSSPPPLAKIDTLIETTVVTDEFTDFKILPSKYIPEAFVPISPDVSICSECKNELFNPEDRRFRYPFINCTNCGPRLTIIKDTPYDRPQTTMAPFIMCDQCKVEYENPLDRRFHAQPIACPNCGPYVWLERENHKILRGDDAIQNARQLLSDGKIIAIKGLGGFHLACDATNPKAIHNLRERKKRSDKPFAVMVFDVKTASKYCTLSKSEKSLLNCKESPIVILKKKNDQVLPEAIAPGRKTIGVMLPYTPLHLLLLEKEKSFPDILVMTSGNMSEEPIVTTNESAIEELGSIADGFLLHDRAIFTRVDDSVLLENNGEKYFFRRSRGYAPNAIPLPMETKEILAVGGELKNTFCLTKNKYAFISHHIGDLKNLETYQAFSKGIQHFQNILKTKPEYIACDSHPEYLSTKFANSYSEKERIPLIKIQHHHAHMASCLVDNMWNGDGLVIGVCLDGTGYGEDGQIWGGEFLIGNYQEYERLFHLEYMPLPGGDKAISNPNRIAAAYLWKLGLEWDERIPAIHSISQEEKKIIVRQLEAKINTPNTSSMGRLFDAVASLIGLRHMITYEAQAAIELEQICNTGIDDAYDFCLEGDLIILKKIFTDIIDDLDHSVPVSTISSKFHNGVANMVLEAVTALRTLNGHHSVALSGGVWQNQYLLNKTQRLLEQAGFTIFLHKNVPTNDGGISLGQSMIANEILSK